MRNEMISNSTNNMAINGNERLTQEERILIKQAAIEVKNLAVLAGEKIMEIYKKDFNVDFKEDQSPLTEADMAANKIIVDGLRADFPDIAILSEEEKDDLSRRDNEWCFIVDPLDGTKEFVKRNGEFTVNIALAKNQHAVVGVIYVPVEKTLYCAAEGLGAFKEIDTDDGRERIQLSVTNKTKDLTVVGSKSHASDQLKSLLEDKKDLVKEVKSAGSSLKGCMVAEGKADIYYRFGLTSEWDTAAMQVIVEQAGGIFRQMDNSPMLYNREKTLNEKGFYVVNCKENIWV